MEILESSFLAYYFSYADLLYYALLYIAVLYYKATN